MAITKTKPIRATVKKSLDYIMNPDKTDDKLLISSYMCSPETADLEWEFTRSKAQAGGCQLARHLIQSFAPGEVDFDTAHEIGKRLADKVLGGKYEYVLATHIDRGNIHNHIIFNTVNFKDYHKYQSNKSSYNFIRRTSDMLCKEYGLSVIEPTQNKGKSYIEYTADKNGMSWKTKLRRTINDQILYATNFDDFLKRIEQQNYQIKHGKYLSFCAEGQQRFIRSKTLGEDFTEEAIRERIAGIYKPKTIPMLIDIQNNIKCQQSRGYEQWAKVHNLKIMSQTFNYLQDNNLLNYDDLSDKINSVFRKSSDLNEERKSVETRITEVEYIIKNIDVYQSHKPVDGKFKNKEAAVLYKSAKEKLQQHLNADNKLPNLKTFKTELVRLHARKSKIYEERESVKAEENKIMKVRENVDAWLPKSIIRSKNRDQEAL